MKQKFLLGCALLSTALLLAGCTTVANHPLEKNEATAVPGLSMELHAATASQSNVDEVEATLYYRFQSTGMLASEARTLTVRRDESMELAILRALLEGPSAGHADLVRLLPETVSILDVTTREGILYITLNEAFLTDDSIPEKWQETADWAIEAPLRRALTVGSMVASITENLPYTWVQIMVQSGDNAQSSLRLDNRYFLTGLTGPSDPQSRNEALLLTPQNTAMTILSAWQQREDELLYAFVSTAGGSAKPAFTQFQSDIDKYGVPSSFAVSGGNVSETGQKAVVTVQVSPLNPETASAPYPLLLERENGIWKIAYDKLISVIARTGGNRR